MPPSPHDSYEQFNRLHKQLESEGLVEILLEIDVEKAGSEKAEESRLNLFRRFENWISNIWKEIKEHREED